MKMAVQLKSIEEVVIHWKRWKLYISISAFVVQELVNAANVAAAAAAAAAEANADDVDERLKWKQLWQI